MKRKSIIIIIIIIILFFAVFIVKSYFFNQISPNNNENIIVGIESVEIESMQDYDVKFRAYGWSEKLKKAIDKSPGDYMFISIYYVVKNLSDNTEMQDIRFCLKPDKNMRGIVETFNPGNGTYFITAFPMKTTGLRQHILIKKDGKSENEILDLIYEQTTRMTYYTGASMTSGGHISKYNYTFNIKNAIETYQKNSNIFAN